MLKSSNFNSIIDAVEGAETNAGEGTSTSFRPESLNLNDDKTTTDTPLPPKDDNSTVVSPTSLQNSAEGSMENQPETSIASLQLAAGLLQIYEPPLIRVRGQLKELIGKQNKVYIDVMNAKHQLDSSEMAQLHDMMINVKIYREKLIKIKKQMQSIYQRTKVLKKRAANIQACKQKELQRKLHKQQQEESLIGSSQR